MNPRNPPSRCARRGRAGDRRGFTLLEICMVLFIIAIFSAIALPSVESAFSEQGLRGDGRQLALLVKTGMLQSADNSRVYALDLTPTTAVLSTAPDPNATDEEATTTVQLDPANKILEPNPNKAGAWLANPKASWLFKPGELCPVPRLRLERGTAWMEMSFNALTGNVEDEALYSP